MCFKLRRIFVSFSFLLYKCGRILFLFFSMFNNIRNSSRFAPIPVHHGSFRLNSLSPSFINSALLNEIIKYGKLGQWLSYLYFRAWIISFYILFIYYLFLFLSVFLFSFHFVYVCVCIDYSCFQCFTRNKCFTIAIGKSRPDIFFFRIKK